MVMKLTMSPQKFGWGSDAHEDPTEAGGGNDVSYHSIKVGDTGIKVGGDDEAHHESTEKRC